MIEICILLFHVIGYVYGVQNYVIIYEGTEFSGPGVGIYFSVGDCVNFGEDWQNRVSSANTVGECVQIYNDLDCKGKMTYLLPGSPSHNNFKALDINDVTKSFRSCDLNEEPVCIICDRKTRRNMAEYNFWYYYFATHGESLQRDFEKQVELEGGFIKWNFVLGNKVSSNKGDQYEEVLDWMKNVVNANLYPPNNNFCKSFLQTLVKMGERVLNERKDELSSFDADWNDRKYVVHAHLITKWSVIVNNLRYALSRKNHKEC